MDMHLLDGTYELFRHFFAIPPAVDVSGQEIAAVRGVLTSVLSMIERGATHIGVATDHVVESFRNDLYPGYKTSEGVPAELLSQFPILGSAGGDGSRGVADGLLRGGRCGRGTEPTVTDANLMLGRLDPELFLGGEMVLDETRARQYLEQSKGPLASVEESGHSSSHRFPLRRAGRRDQRR